MSILLRNLLLKGGLFALVSINAVDALAMAVVNKSIGTVTVAYNYVGGGSSCTGEGSADNLGPGQESPGAYGCSAQVYAASESGSEIQFYYGWPTCVTGDHGLVIITGGPPAPQGYSISCQ